VAEGGLRDGRAGWEFAEEGAVERAEVVGCAGWGVDHYWVVGCVGMCLVSIGLVECGE